ncbi:MAG: BufA2 family periplasmic bufferin-type metallophore [Steroidobacteraceae bacterium]
MRKNSSGVAIATAAAMLFGTGFMGSAAAADASAAAIHCHGVNSCKGQSACKSAHNACKGQNSCKGKGFLEMTRSDCTAAKAKMKEDK